MKKIPLVKFSPHPSEIAENFLPVVRPSVAFSVGDLFQGEMRVLLLCMQNSRNVSFETIIQYARQKYLDNDSSDDIAYIALYHLIHKDYAYEGNADDMWTDATHYVPLLKFPSIQIVMKWVVWSVFSQSNEFLERNAKDLTDMTRRADLTFLFEKTGVSLVNHSGSDETDHPLVGQIANLSEKMSSMTSVMDRTFRKLESFATEIGAGTKETKYCHFEALEEDIIDHSAMTLEEVARKAFELTNEGTPLPADSYSTYWTAPPPVSLTNMYSMAKLSDASKSFLVDSFLDIYNAQLTMLSVHFYLRRMIALWKNTDSVVESALFSKEMSFLKLTLATFVDKIGSQFSLKFLAMEGINLTGAKNIEVLKEIFPAPGARTAIKPIIDIEKYLEGVIETVRDCCVGLDRLRVSMLYGRKHPSYVGDGFLTSYLYRNYITRHAGSAIETIMAVTPALANMTLPADQRKSVQFYNELFGHSLDSAGDRFVIEPEMREQFNEKVLNLVGGTQSRGYSRSVPVSEELHSLFPVTTEGKLLLGLIETMWTESAYLTAFIEEPEMGEDGKETEGPSYVEGYIMSDLLPPED